MMVEFVMGKHAHQIKPNSIAHCTYCQPKVANVGLTEEKAKVARYDIKFGLFPLSATAKPFRFGEPGHFVKSILDVKIGGSLGEHMIGVYMSELVQG